MPQDNPAAPDLEEFRDAADASTDAGIADETAAYDEAMMPTEDDDASDEAAAQPS